ncbi:MAG: hypothetical protein WC436_05365, partial [Candidatus Babeliales bacterium]
MNLEKIATTPLMQQYFEIKSEYSDTLLLFQVGDFYELFFDDAKKASAFLAITLTKRGKNNGQDVPLCGIPVHALTHYLVKLIKGGFRVAICDQVTKPMPGTVVKRKVTQVFTPGTLVDSNLLDEKSASYLFSFFPLKDSWGLIFSELLTAQLYATVLPAGAYKMVESELVRFFPDEIILPNLKETKSFDTYFKKLGYFVSLTDFFTDINNLDLSDKCDNQDINNYSSNSNLAQLWLEKQFSHDILEKINSCKSINNTLHVLYFYLKKNHQDALEQFKTIRFYEPEDYLILDYSTQKNLEVIKNIQDGSRKNSVLSVLDRAKTSMGSRTVKKWLLRPLVDKNIILQRQEFVLSLYKQIDAMQQFEALLSNICDIERIIGRIALSKALIQDFLGLKRSLIILPAVKNILQQNINCALSKVIQEKIFDYTSLVNLLECSLIDTSSDSISEQISFSKYIIKKGFDLELDRLRDLVENGQKEILKLEQKEVDRTKINSLKIRFNNITGYYIEITNPNLHLVPSDYIEKQKLVNRKRFVTKELIELEQELTKAQNEIEIVEQKVFSKVKSEVM